MTRRSPGQQARPHRERSDPAPPDLAPPLVERHFTVSTFVSLRGATALHWHRLGMWLPPGGHIEPNEDPIQAALREAEEETGLPCEIVRTSDGFDYASPRQLPPPVTIGVYDIDEPANPHQHIDLVYFARPLADPARSATDEAPALPCNFEAWRWVRAEALRGRAPLTAPDGSETPIAEDVRRLGLAAIAAADGGR